MLGQADRLLTVVRHQQRCRIESSEHLRQFVEQLRVTSFVKAGKRLIEQYQGRSKTQCPRETHSPPFATGETVRSSFSEILDAEQVQSDVNPFMSLTS
jgi:hypothetical protein